MDVEIVDMVIDIPSEKRDENGNVLCVITRNGTKEFYNGVKVEYSGCVIKFGSGKDNTVILYEGTKFKSSEICFGNNCFVSIGYSSHYIAGLHILPVRGKNLRVIIGENFSCWGAVFKMGDDKDIIIGDDCQFSYGIHFWNGDGHAIIDTATGKCINPGKEIVIGNHVWIGNAVQILKGTKISDHSVVGASSLVNKEFDKSNVIIAGNPARIIKEKITWDRMSPGRYMEAQFQKLLK